MKDITTSGVVDYSIKKHSFKRCFKKAKVIFTDANFTISRCNHYFPKYTKKLVLTYPGLSKNIIEYGKNHPRLEEKENTIVFVGNVKPHKGLDTLLNAFSKVDKKFQLKIIGQKEKFLVGSTFDESKYQNVVFTGRISDDELMDEIAKATYLVQPSLYEGFGVPPLEALYLGTVPIISNIEVFKEVYKDLSVIYFNDADDLAKIINDNVKVNLSSRDELYERYNFTAMTEKVMHYLVNNNGDSKEL